MKRCPWAQRRLSSGAEDDRSAAPWPATAELDRPPNDGAVTRPCAKIFGVSPDAGQGSWDSRSVGSLTAEAFAAALLRYGSDAIAVSERETGRYLVVSDSYCALTGFTREELIDHTSIEIGLLGSYAARSGALRLDAEDTTDVIHELTLRRRNGESVLVEFSIQFLDGGELMLTITRDITERRRTEARLQASEDRFRTAVESMLDVFTIISPVRDDDGEIVDFRYEYANQAYCDLIGLSRERILAGTGTELVAGFAGTERFRAYCRTVMTGRPSRMVDVIPFAGSPTVRAGLRHVDINVVALGDALVVSGRDITARHEDEQRIRELNEDLDRRARELAIANRELESRTDAIERLAGGVAHELNNKLAIILGFNDLVARRLGESHPLRPDLDEVREAARRSSVLTRDLLAFAGRQVLDPKPIVASELARSLGRLLPPTVGSDIELVIDDDAGDARVLGDAAQLEHALLYLALNARDAMPGGGRLTIRASRSPAQTAGAGSAGGGNGDNGVNGGNGGGGEGEPARSVLFSVSDTGTGIPEEVRERIFEPFFTTKGVGEGTGLGLAAVQGIVERTGGTIAVESTPGAGSTFIVTLPEFGAAAAGPARS